jgi:hypothetical protein
MPYIELSSSAATASADRLSESEFVSADNKDEGWHLTSAINQCHIIIRSQDKSQFHQCLDETKAPDNY